MIAALRHGGALPRHVRPVLARLERDLGIRHVLASQQLWSKRPDLFDATGMEACLSRITFDPDGYASLIRLPGYEVADVVVDPTRGFGQPIFSQGGARLVDALAMLRAGEPVESVAAELGMSRNHLEDAVRVAAARGR